MHPLSGIKIVEFEGIGPGPLAGFMLAQMGATVNVVERPGAGDDKGGMTVIVAALRAMQAAGTLKDALDGFIERTQRTVNGTVKVKLHKGNATVVGRSSANSLYVPDMATYDAGDQFDHRAAEGFIYVWGLPTRLWAASQR